MAKQGIHVDITGTRGVINAIKKYGEDGAKLVRNQTEVSARGTEKMAKNLAPIDTGKLWQSIKAERQTDYWWNITAFIDYARWVEFGTSRMMAQPFLFPAWRYHGKEYIKELQRGFNDLARKFNK
jgi:HK97 gp10 family phage protein